MKSLPLLFAIAFLVIAGCHLNAPVTVQKYSGEIFPQRQLYFEGRHYEFRIYVPNVQRQRPPIMLYLHGSDERGDDNEGQLSGPASIIQSSVDRFDFIIVFPQCPAGRFWDEQMTEVALAELQQTIMEFDADESRIYLSGFSLGGYGAWTMAAMYPNKFAAVVPMSGRLLPRSSELMHTSPAIRELADAEDPFAAIAQRLSKTPIWIFHGTEDKIVPIDNSRRMAKALRDAGNSNCLYSELEGVGHVTLDIAFRDPKLFVWLSEQHIRDL